MQEQLDELVRHYFEEADYETEAVPFGLTNLTKIVTLNDQRYVLRVYNRHTKHAEGIEFESIVTSFLANKELSFQVPEFLPTLSGDDYVRLSGGSLGALVVFLEGTNHVLANVHDAAEFGRVAGEMSQVLQRFDRSGLDYQGISFGDYYNLHPLADQNAVAAFIENPSFHIPEASLNFYITKVEFVGNRLSEIQKLPVQLVHHDLLIFNLLAQNNRICGVLDFDFISVDTSFMEFAICFNHILQMSNGSLEMAEGFVKSYSVYRTHSLQEIEQLRNLTQVYHLAVLHIYIGQHYAGIDIQHNFTYIMNQFIHRDMWLKEHGKTIEQMLIAYLVG
ncbi:phosphotransferase [Paenibacillus sp. CGMCC 1.16610]|uniref:Phosphotransferase n=1 Tax=Paenibacillus anseongense TaxID=2682845 RepID=A0ABW9UJ60_9BACL|nr:MULTISPECIES: phosphotransferase [Paenibacillus]MBA2941413.1 phosphotransferase [Paenibacillus sp. CGMCC 1.16610]MVQ40232.1 phosphotransferase [Paenibacillus anseongense]